MSKLKFLNGYAWAIAGVAVSTALFWLLRSLLDKGQASLLFLPLVIVCAITLGYGPAILASILSFIAWDFFFLPPVGTLIVNDPKDWLSLIVFLIAAITTSRLAAQSRAQTANARAREAELATLFQASETISREIDPQSVLATLSQQLMTLCHSGYCAIYSYSQAENQIETAYESSKVVIRPDDALVQASIENRVVIGFDQSARNLWAKAVDTEKLSGVYVPLLTKEQPVGCIYLANRSDGSGFSRLDQRLILTLANYAATVIARENLAEQAAQVSALREADSLKTALLSLVSHELRSPLTTIKANVSHLIRSNQTLAIAEQLSAIDSEADRLTRLVENLLNLSRLEGGAWEPEKDWCDLNEVVATALDGIDLPDADRFYINSDHNLPLIRADYTQISLVLANLFQNALKYAPSNSKVDVELRTIFNGIDDCPSGVIIKVRDYGNGIASTDMEKIFDRFYRSAIHQKSAVHGTGLGLALCKAIVSAHCGKIAATNASVSEQRGAIFTVELPIG